MKLIKGLGLLSFLVFVTGSCFEPPEFPVAPQIEYERIEFKGVPLPGVDSLILYLRFKDGDGDLGLGKGREHNIEPFQDSFFYQERNGQVEPLTVEPGSIDDEFYDLIHIPNPENGKLVFFRTSKNPAYSFLPQTYHCSSYEFLAGPVQAGNPQDGRRVVIEKRALASLDPLVQLVDSFPKNDPQYYQIKDTLYYTPNPDHFNIEVDFLIKDPTAPGGFIEFDWQKEYCTTFDGRFPVFSDKKSSVDGTLRYSMESVGFQEIFSIKTLKLRVQIKDRNLNVSNVIETDEFQLH